VENIAYRRGIRIGRLRSLEPVLKEYQRVIVSLGSRWAVESEDVPWWYNERASLSILAGAIWRAHGWAFEEFSTLKSSRDAAQVRGESSGRCDINFAFRGHEYAGEAKQCWPKLQDGKRAFGEVKLSLQAALKDGQRIPPWGIPILAIVFVSPRIPRGDVRHTERAVLSLLHHILKIPNTSVVWAFPRAAQALTPSGRNSELVYPGTITILKRAA